jgi:hypothetical protein
MGPEVIIKYTPASIPGLYLPYTGKKFNLESNISTRTCINYLYKKNFHTGINLFKLKK